MHRLRLLLTIPMTRHIAVNTAGNYLNVAFTVVYTLVLVRIFDPTEYGIFSVLVGLSSVLANILDFGVTASIFAQLPSMYDHRDEALVFLKTNFIFQTFLSFVALIIIALFIGPIDQYVLKLSAPSSAYFIAFIAVPLLIWQNSVLNAMYATKKFFKANLYINAANLSKMAVLFLCIFRVGATVSNVLFSLFIAGPLTFLILVISDNRHLVRRSLKRPLQRSHVKLSYSITYFMATQFFNLGSRIDLFMLSFFLPTAQVGIYAPAQKIMLTILTAVNSITQVLSPQFAHAKNRKEVTSLLKKGYFYILLPVLLFAGVIFTPFSIYELFFTSTFSHTASIARSLSIPYILFSLTTVPLLFFLYTIKKPRYLFYANLLFLCITSVLCFLLIPRLGLFGPPVAFGFAFTMVALYISVVLIKEIREME